jgi:hypothetical protein
VLNYFILHECTYEYGVLILGNEHPSESFAINLNI